MILTFVTSHCSVLLEQKQAIGMHIENQITKYNSPSPKGRKILRNNTVHLIKNKKHGFIKYKKITKAQEK